MHRLFKNFFHDQSERKKNEMQRDQARRDRAARAARAQQAARAARLQQAVRAVLQRRRMVKRAFQKKYKQATRNYLHAERELRRIKASSKVVIAWTLRNKISINLLDTSAFLINPHQAGRDDHLVTTVRLIKELAEIGKHQAKPEGLSLEMTKHQLFEVIENLAASHLAVVANQTECADQISTRNSRTIEVLTKLPVHSVPDNQQILQQVDQQIDQSSTDSDGGELVVFKIAGRPV